MLVIARQKYFLIIYTIILMKQLKINFLYIRVKVYLLNYKKIHLKKILEQ